GGSAAGGGRNAAPAHPAAPGALPAQPSPHGTADYGTDGFATETDPTTHPQSTFAMDVDTASYGHARNLLKHGQHPDAGSVRPEEFVNSFRQDYQQPEGNGFTVAVDGARLPAAHHPHVDGDVRLMRVGLQTRGEDRTNRPDATLTL